MYIKSFKLIPLLALIFCLLPNWNLLQSQECIDFEDFEIDTRFGIQSGHQPGDVAFERNGIPVTVENFLYEDNTTGFFNNWITDFEFGNSSSGKYLFSGNTNLKFHFNEIDEVITKICFQFLDGGGEENLAVNGEPISVLRKFSDAVSENFAPGVSVSVELDPNSNNLEAGILCLTGKIETLTVGGQELLLDNICYETEQNTTDLCADFESFEQMQFGGLAGNNPGDLIFDKDNIAINVIPLQRLNWVEGFDYLHVIEKDENDDFTTAMGKYLFMDNINTAFNFSNFESEIEKISFDFYYGFGEINLSVNGRQVLILDNLSPGTIGLTPEIKMEISLDPNHPQLGKAVIFGPVKTLLLGGLNFKIDNLCLNAAEACRIFDFIAETTRCNDDGKFFIELDFEHENTSEKFSLWINENEASFHRYAELPLRLGPFTGPIEQELFLQVKDYQNPECSAKTRLEPVECPVNECSFSNLEIQGVTCSNNGTYTLKLKFDHNNTSEKFKLTTKGGFQETYSYANFPGIIQGLPIPQEGFELITICDTENPNCCAAVDFRLECEQVCQIRDLTAKTLECQDDGSFYVELDFIHESNNEFFKVYVNEDFLDEYAYESLPLKIGPFQTSPNEVLNIWVKDVSGQCEARTRVEGRNCNPSVCSIDNIIAEAYACENGTFKIDLEISANNPGILGYYVYVDGEIFGPFNYEQTFVTLNPVEVKESGSYNILVIDIANPACFGFKNLEFNDCENNTECRIKEVAVDILDCNPDGTFNFKLRFEAQNPGNDFFDLIDHEGNNIGFYKLAALPVKVENFKSRNLDYEFIKICINDNPNCCQEFEFKSPDCSDQNECKIAGIQVDSIACTSDSTFNFQLEFEYANASDEYFDIFDHLGNNIGFHKLSELPVKVEDLFIRDSEYAFIKICINDNPDCCKEFEFKNPDCTDTPGIVWPGDANINNIVKHFDLLNIGLAFGAEGPERSNQGIEWQAYEASDWNQSFIDGLNYKFSDANGDGLIDMEDRVAIIENYDLTNGDPQPYTPLPTTDFDPPIFVDLTDVDPNNGGQQVTVPIILGTEEMPVENIYGIAFTVKYDPELIDPDEIQVEYPASWFGEDGVNFITVHKVQKEKDEIEIAMTRIDQNNVSGFGKIAQLRIIIDNIAGIVDKREFEATDVQAISSDGLVIPINGLATVLNLAGEGGLGKEIGYIDLKRNIKIVPNPTQGNLSIENKYNLPVDKLEVLTPDGQHIGESILHQNNIDISTLPDGIYILRIVIGEHTLHERVVKI